MKAIALVLFLTALAPGVAHAAGSTTAGSASATIVTPLVLTHAAGNQLNFGRFIPGTGGTVVVSETTGAGSTTGGVTFASGSATADDTFLVTAQSYQFMNIVTSPGTVNSGANSMSFTTKPMLPSGEIAAAQGTTGYFTVGGTLNVAATQAPGTYSGSYTVTVTYN